MGVKCPNKGAKWRLLREHATLLVSNDSPNPLRSSLCLVISYRCICVFFCIAGTAYRSDLLCGKDVKDGGPCPPYENSFGPGLRTYVESGDCTNGLGESLLVGRATMADPLSGGGAFSSLSARCRIWGENELCCKQLSELPGQAPTRGFRSCRTNAANHHAPLGDARPVQHLGRNGRDMNGPSGGPDRSERPSCPARESSKSSPPCWVSLLASRPSWS